MIHKLNHFDEKFDTKTVTTYFSLDMEKALLFEQKFQNVTAEFSMKKFWLLTLRVLILVKMVNTS